MKQRPGGTRKWTIGTLKVNSRVPDSIGCREVSMANLKCGDHPSERPLTGTGTLKKFRKNNLPERILTLATKHDSGREERVQESTVICK